MSTRQYLAEVDIDAPKEKVWSVLKDIEGWPTWTPTMTSVVQESGDVFAVGSTYSVKQPGLARTLFTIGSLIDGEAFMWSSRAMAITTIADHQLSVINESRTRVRLVLEMRGLAASFLWLLLGKKVREFVDTEATSLKSACSR